MDRVSSVSLEYILDCCIYLRSGKNQNLCFSDPFPQRLAPRGDASFQALRKSSYTALAWGMRREYAYKQHKTNCKVRGEKIEKKLKKQGKERKRNEEDTKKHRCVRQDNAQLWGSTMSPQRILCYIFVVSYSCGLLNGPWQEFQLFLLPSLCGGWYFWQLILLNLFFFPRQ